MNGGWWASDAEMRFIVWFLAGGSGVLGAVAVLLLLLFFPKAPGERGPL